MVKPEGFDSKGNSAIYYFHGPSIYGIYYEVNIDRSSVLRNLISRMCTSAVSEPEILIDVYMQDEKDMGL